LPGSHSMEFHSTLGFEGASPYQETACNRPSPNFITRRQEESGFRWDVSFSFFLRVGFSLMILLWLFPDDPDSTLSHPTSLRYAHVHT
jgi:hypothetical protein